jgi:hypothetical protein
VIRNPENLSASASLRVVRNSVAHDDDVSELIPEFLLAQGRGSEFQGYCESLSQRNFERSVVVQADWGAALSASYLIGSVSRGNGGVVKFWLAGPPVSPESTCNV